MRLAMVHKRHDEKEEHKPDMRGTYYPIGDDETEMRRRSRSAYEDGYADAMRRARQMRDEEDEMRRRSRSMHEDEPDMRRGRRSRSFYDEEDNEPDMRRGRRSRSEAPWDKWGDEDEHRKIGFHADGGEHEKGGDIHGMASKVIDPRLESILEDAVKVMENPPHTWEAYLKRKQYDGIARMEGKELMEALEEGKAAKDIKKELVHTIAALFMIMSK